jgi:hypothetical protein
MNTRISKISLSVFTILLVLSPFLLSVPGEYWPWFAVMSIFAVVALISGPRRYRLFGAGALALAVLLIVDDYAAGKRFQVWRHHLSLSHQR